MLDAPVLLPLRYALESVYGDLVPLGANLESDVVAPKSLGYRERRSATREGV